MKAQSFLLAVLLFLTGTVDLPAVEPVDSCSTNAVIRHAEQLAKLGPRTMGSENLEQAASYIEQQLQSIGIPSHREYFEYNTYKTESLFLICGKDTFSPVLTVLDPYTSHDFQNRKAELVPVGSTPAEDLSGKVVVSNHPAMQFMLLPATPELIITLKEEDFEALQSNDSLIISLVLTGEQQTCRSFNIVAEIGQDKDGFIALTAHFDSYTGSPGANDNGSGIGAVLELATFFNQRKADLRHNLRLIFFSGEEKGFLGSTAYLRKHIGEMGNCLFDLNFDTLGGDEGPVIATNAGSGGLSETNIEYRFPEDLSGRAMEGPDSMWRIQHPLLMPIVQSSYYPEDLSAKVSACADAAGITVSQKQLMSDHQVFALCGIPALSLQSSRHHIHSAGDLPQNLNSSTIEKNIVLGRAILTAYVFGN